MVLTRLDLLNGFAALFHSLDKKDRDAILGVTFTRRAHESDGWRSELGAFGRRGTGELALSDLVLAQTGATPQRCVQLLPSDAGTGRNRHRTARRIAGR